MRIVFTSLLAAASLSAASLAFAQVGPDADFDQDGAISQTEFLTQSNTRFARIDTNGDGLLSEDERQAAHEVFRAERENKRFAKIDTNGDGVISREEFAAMSQGRMMHGGKRGADDRDHNRPRRHMRGQDGTSSDGSPKRGGPKQGGHWAKVDTNNDGFISRGEYDAGAQAMFKRMDRNGDGVINKSDRPQRGDR